MCINHQPAQTLSEAEPSVPRSRFSADAMDQARAERLAFLRSKYRDLRNIERAVQPSARQLSAQGPEAESQDGSVEEDRRLAKKDKINPVSPG